MMIYNLNPKKLIKTYAEIRIAYYWGICIFMCAKESVYVINFYEKDLNLLKCDRALFANAIAKISLPLTNKMQMIAHRTN